MAELKYVAAGFLNDAEKLLLDFIRENSMEFSVFAEVWKKHNFSLIFAGRANGKELREFTLEIFLISINFLESGSSLYQVGGIFLLYALYRNQILSPPMKIRIILSQLKIITDLLEVSRTENCRSLHYVISYLVENAFVFVACPKLKGPNSIKNEVYQEKDEQNPKVQESDIKYELTEIVETNVLHEIDGLFTQYEETVASLNNPFVDLTSKHPSFKEFAHQIDELLNGGRITDEDAGTRRKKSVSGSRDTSLKNSAIGFRGTSLMDSGIGSDVTSLVNSDTGSHGANQKNSAIGSRRALLKAAAFSNQVFHYLSHDENATTTCVSDGNESADEVDTVPESPQAPIATPAVPRKRRPFRRGKRKIGRPKKLPADRLAELVAPPNPTKSKPDKGAYGERGRRPRGPQFTRIRHYYADLSDTDDHLDEPSTSYCLPKEEYYVFSSDSDSSVQL